MAGLDAFGTQLKRGDGGAPETFTALANVTSIGGPGLEREMLDTTAHDSPEQWEEAVGGIKRSGEVSLDINYDPADHDALTDDFADKTPRNYQLVWPTEPPTTWAFKAWLKGFEPDAPHDDKLTASVTFKITGKPAIP